MVDELMRAFRDRSSSASSATAVPSPHVTLAAVNPAPQPETPSDPLPPVPNGPEIKAEDEYGCFATARGQAARGFKVRLRDRYFSCQYLAFIRTGEQSGWDADLGKEALYVIFHWGTLLITGKGLATLDDLLNEHKIACLSLGEGKHGVRIDDIRILPREREIAPSTPARRAKGTSSSQ